TVLSWMAFQTGTAAADWIGLGCNAGELAFANKCRRKTSPAEQGGTSLTSTEPATENFSGAIGGLISSEDGSSAAPATAPPSQTRVMTDSKLVMMLLRAAAFAPRFPCLHEKGMRQTNKLLGPA